MKKLYFIRHGLSEMNMLGLRAGTTETPLTAEGRLQAKKASQKVETLKIDLIVSSPQGRAIETAQIIAKEISYPEDKILQNNLLIERHFGSLEGTPWDPYEDIEVADGIETMNTLLNRTALALSWLQTLNAQNILVVGHGASGRALRSLLQPEYQFNNTEQIQNAQIIRWL